MYLTVKEAIPTKHLHEKWAAWHIHAINAPSPVEQPIVKLLQAWLAYASQHASTYDWPIGEDFVLGRYWQDIGEAIRGMLNGTTGRLDCGTLDGFILNTMAEQGIDISKL